MDMFVNGKSLGDIIKPSLFMPFQRTLTSNDDLNTQLDNGIYKTTDKLPKNCDPFLTWAFVAILAYDNNTIIQIGLKADANGVLIKTRYVSVRTHIQSDWKTLG